MLINLGLSIFKNDSSWVERRKIIYTIKNHNSNPEKVAKIIQKVKAIGGLEYAETKMIEYREKALNFISSFVDSDYKTSLIKLIMYTTERKK